MTDDLQIYDVEQNSDAWLAARMGIPTASAFSQVLAKGEGLTRATYMHKLAGEIITGRPAKNFSNEDTDRGHEQEPEARDLYRFNTGAETVKIGFARNHALRAGCSPDSFIGDDGGLEIKTTEAHLLIDLIRKDDFPPKHKAQVQGTLWVLGRQWWDIAIYCPGMPLFVKRATRDEAYIGKLAEAVAVFHVELDQVVKMVRAYGGEDTLLADLKASVAA
jgi:hypothetical protein